MVGWYTQEAKRFELPSQLRKVERVPRVCCCLLPALAHHRQSEEGTQRPWVRGPGHGEHVSSHKLVTSTLREPRVTHEATQAVCRELRHTAQERCQPARLLNLPIHGKALNSNPLTWIIWFALIYKKTFDIEDHRPFVANLLYSLAPTSTSSERCSQGHLRCCLQGPSPKNFHQIKHNSVF